MLFLGVVSLLPWGIQYGMRNGASALDPRLLTQVRGCDLAPVQWIRGTRLECYGTELRQAFAAGAPIAVLHDLHKVQLGSTKFAGSCHLLLHPFGRRYSRKASMSRVLTIANDDPCAGGFLHGMIEERFAADEVVPQSTIDAQCKAQTLSALNTCEHTIGHVLMRNTHNNLPIALSRCEDAGDASFARRCAAGAFMENKLAGERRDEATTTRYFDKDDPLLPCGGVTGPLLVTCHAWAAFEVDDGERLEFCSSLPAATNRSCMIVVGVRTRLRGKPVCVDEAACWFGVGFSVEQRCLVLKDADNRAACYRGAGYFRGLDARIASKLSSTQLCRDLPRVDATPCADGAGRRGEAMDFM